MNVIGGVLFLCTSRVPKNFPYQYMLNIFQKKPQYATEKKDYASLI